MGRVRAVDLMSNTLRRALPLVLLCYIGAPALAQTIPVSGGTYSQDFNTLQLDFQYSLDATSLTTGTWVNVNALDFLTPNTATVGAKDGNAVGNRTHLAATISGLPSSGRASR